MSFGWLWGANDLEDNQEVEHESGCARMGSAICAAICCAPVLLIVMLILLGWNEKRAVCDAKAIASGKEVVVEVGCSSWNEGDGKLVMFSCDMERDGLPSFTPGGAFNSVVSGYVGTGLSVKAEMMQCVEHEHSETKKDNVGGGKTTIKTYTYSVEYRDSRVDSGAFRKRGSTSFQQNCGADNPAWPSDLPTTQTFYANEVKAGSFTLGEKYVRDIPLTTPLIGGAAPYGWQLSGNVYSTTRYRVGAHNIGSARVSFSGTNWDNPRITALGKNSGGTIVEWTAPSYWLCSGYTLRDVRPGTVSKDALFKKLEAEASGLTWILRIVGFLIGWAAFAMLAGPLEVAADCIPCIGPYLGNSIKAVACCVACLPATACCLCVIGIVWVAMRPLVGIPLMLFFCCAMGVLVAFKLHSRKGGGNSKIQPAVVVVDSAPHGGKPAQNGGEPAQNGGEPGQNGGGGSAPVPPDVASGFLNALRGEYVRNEEGVVGNFLDTLGADQQATLGTYEEQVRDSADLEQAINDIEQRWGV